ncbi:MAG TPA: YicC/YloC family endoribonuclease [Opitutaceae bacterium]|nr:YicC/YloC family endoribonuclease [Opitutaceae bacterium]
MRSMTGYGRASAALGNSTLTVQVSSVNRKTLDLTVSIPEEWESLEPKVGELVRKHAARGKIHVDIEVTGNSSANVPTWDEAAIAQVVSKLSALTNRLGHSFNATPELLWQIANSQRTEGDSVSMEIAEPVIVKSLEEALEKFAAMRAKEGAALLSDLLARLQILTGHVAIIAERSAIVPKNYREQLMLRLRQAGLELNLDDERVLKEVALFADRCDISEEITRLRSHFEQFTALLNGNTEIGRKAEFILQEMGREVHTIGSKANDLTISRSVIELKNELERIREQVANVE